MQAFIYQYHKKISAPRPLQINDGNIAFFTRPVMETSEFLSSDDGKVWQLKFFINSAFEKTLFVDFNAPGDVPALGRASWYDNKHKASNDERLIPAASVFLRDSDTLTLARAEELTANRTLLADRDGFAYFSGDSDQFKRIVLCQALAIAYVQVITTCMADTTRSVLNNRTDETIALYENILRFNAAYYFTLPVLVGRHELFAAWRVLCDHYHLKVLSQELTQQLSDVAALLSGQREKQQAEDEAKRRAEEDAHKQALAAQAAREEKALAEQRALEKQALAAQKAHEDKADKRRGHMLSFAGLFLSIAGLFLTGMSLLSLLQLTPTQFFDNASQWKRWMSTSTAKKTAGSSQKLDEGPKPKG
ncbi:hypothetical protein HAV22_13875 [Massilia sp. TW-1]|uniref:Uncharacterized protein n=1 Tax=Telluria antibiotica TaxID=2717319 RepID=A0ABX0PBK3_9BURK|nr:hypothetical protein [Telluria antibiotica]NIA54725.1 hypothetical protein [Telluria antibiotica]